MLQLFLYHQALNNYRYIFSDQIPPTITCSTPSAYVITSQSSTIRIDPKDLVTAVENGAQVTANSGIFTLTYNDVGRVRMITLTAIDAALNTQSCTVQVYTTGKYIHFPPAYLCIL